MYTAEQLQVVAKEQYGTRKNKAAIEQCLNKRLTFDLARQLKRPLAMCSNDAKSCYDRIVHSVASLCMRRMGVEAPPIVCMFTTIQNLQHSIRTVYGDSELTFTGQPWTVPIQGVGQGNGGGRCTWCCGWRCSWLGGGRCSCSWRAVGRCGWLLGGRCSWRLQRGLWLAFQWSL
jgi:hypothetical protein